MALKFSDYRSARDSAEFNSRFNDLCEAIAVSGVKFETYWAEHFLPTLTESAHVSDEVELLNEIWPFSSKKQAPAQPVEKFVTTPKQQMTDRLDQWQNDQRAAAAAAKEAARQRSWLDSNKMSINKSEQLNKDS